MAPEVKKELTEFDKLIADCEAVLNRKTDIILLWNTLKGILQLIQPLFISNAYIYIEMN